MRLSVLDVDLQKQSVNLLLIVSTRVLQVLQVLRLRLAELLIIGLDPLAELLIDRYILAREV